MPHLVILYTGNLDAIVDMPALCRELADTMLAVRDDDGAQVFPTGGTRVLAYPAPHFAVADGGAAGRAAGGGKTGVFTSDGRLTSEAISFTSNKSRYVTVFSGMIPFSYA